MIADHSAVNLRYTHQNCECNFKSRVLRFLCGALIVLCACRSVSCLDKSSRPKSSLDSLVSHYDLVRLDASLPLPSATPKLIGPEPDAAHSGIIPIHVRVQALGRLFEISLRSGESVFTSDATVVIHDNYGSEEYPASDFHTGTVEGYVAYEPYSHVHGHLVDGIFDGVIRTRGDTYYVEPARKYFGDEALLEEAIVYRLSDVLPLPSRESGNDPAPDAWMPEGSRNNFSSARKQPSGVLGESSRLSEWLGGGAQRTGRVCKFHVVADHFFYQRLGRGNDKVALAKMEFHMQEADRIFRRTDFDNNNKPDEIRIRIQRVELFKTPSDKSYQLGNPKINATAYLEYFSYYDHDAYCGAMAFSYRAFEDDVLGYAYRGGPTNTGGICYRRRTFTGKKRSMNVGMVSLDSSWGALVQAQSTVVVAHEIGHMFGSPHDDDMDGGSCFNKDNVEQQFLMSAMANPGTSQNNQMFSPCSRRYIQTNLLANGQCLVCRGKDCGAGTCAGPAIALVFLPLLLALFQLFVSTPLLGT